jgi:F420-dependent oxidoreductase-like protein
MLRRMTTPWFGIHLQNHTFPGRAPEQLFDALVMQAIAAEAAGFSLATVMDHLVQIPAVAPETDPLLEGWSTLAALSRETKTMRLGTLVTGVTYRNPAMLAKMATTLDVLSRGRAILGVGAAWSEQEHTAYGYEFPPIGERMDRLDEALTIARLLFTEERPTFHGRHYRIDAALNVPRPIQPGGPRIMVGGGGERRTLKIVARHADMAHWFPLGLDALRHKTEVLERHCEAEGRDPSTIERTMATPVAPGETEEAAKATLLRLPPARRDGVFAGTVEQCAEVLQPYLEDGFTGFTFRNSQFVTPDEIAVVGELLHLIGG